MKEKKLMIMKMNIGIIRIFKCIKSYAFVIFGIIYIRVLYWWYVNRPIRKERRKKFWNGEN